METVAASLRLNYYVYLHLVIIPVAELTFRAERLSDRRGS